MAVKINLSQPALEALKRMREQGQLPSGPLTVDVVVQALERLERRSISQLLLRRELRRTGDGPLDPSQPFFHYGKAVCCL